MTIATSIPTSPASAPQKAQPDFAAIKTKQQATWARLLTAALPRVEVVEFENLGHMGPVTHPGAVNEAIERFLERA